MAFTLSIVAFFAALIGIILIHEFGHYLLARLFGFRVLEYFVGFGPRLWSFRRGEIEYGIKAIPAGGYVKIAGMNPLEDDVPPGDEHRAYYAKPRWQRALVIAAGPVSHGLVALLIFSGIFLVVGDTGTVTKIGGVLPTIGKTQSPASAAGLQAGDVIVQIGSLRNPNPAQLGDFQRQHVGEPIAYVIDRGGQLIRRTITPVTDTTGGGSLVRIGVELSPVPRPFFSALGAGAKEVWIDTKGSVVQIGTVFGPKGIARTFQLLFTDAPRQVTDPGTVVAIGQQVGAVGAQGQWVTFFYMFAYITLFIGLVNLIPLPPFDGGHLAVLLVEWIGGRRVDMRKLIPVSAVVLAFFVLYTTAHVLIDIWKPVSFGP